MRDAGMEWLALNVGDGHSWEDWRIVVDRARALRVDVFPWKRCRTLSECVELLELANEVAFRAILNVEDEFETVVPPAELAATIYAISTVEVGISSVGWLYNDPDYRPLAKYPMLLQIFPADMKRDPSDLQDVQFECVKHAREKGFRYLGVTYQTYGEAEPSWYAFYDGPRSYYTGDDIGAGNWDEWPA